MSYTSQIYYKQSILFIELKTEVLEENEENISLFSKYINDKSVSDIRELYRKTAINIPEFSSIKEIQFSWFEDETQIKTHVLNNGVEKILLEQALKIINKWESNVGKGLAMLGSFKFNTTYSFFHKKSILYGLKIPNLLKANLFAKPWESNVVCVNELWKYKSGFNIQLDIVAETLKIDVGNDALKSINIYDKIIKIL